jgi:hypothetical protein
VTGLGKENCGWQAQVGSTETLQKSRCSLALMNRVSRKSSGEIRFRKIVELHSDITLCILKNGMTQKSGSEF